MEELQVGDYVEADTFYGIFDGYVVSIENNGMVGVVMDGFTKGHNLAGRLPDDSHNGWLVLAKNVTRISSKEQCVSQKAFEDLF